MTCVASVLSRESRKLIMTRSILLCQHHTPFVSLLVGASPRVTSVYERAGAPHSAAASACEREKREPVTGTIVSA